MGDSACRELLKSHHSEIRKIENEHLQEWKETKTLPYTIISGISQLVQQLSDIFVSIH